MSTTSKTFSALGAGAALLLGTDESADYAVSVADAESFIGTLVLQRSDNAGLSWEPVKTWVGTSGTPLTGEVATGTVRSTRRAQYRFACTAFDGASDAVIGALTLDDDVLRRAALVGGEILGRDGQALMRIRDDGVEMRRPFYEGAFTKDDSGVVTLFDAVPYPRLAQFFGYATTDFANGDGAAPDLTIGVDSADDVGFTTGLLGELPAAPTNFFNGFVRIPAGEKMIATLIAATGSTSAGAYVLYAAVCG